MLGWGGVPQKWRGHRWVTEGDVWAETPSRGGKAAAIWERRRPGREK